MVRGDGDLNQTCNCVSEEKEHHIGNVRKIEMTRFDSVLALWDESE